MRENSKEVGPGAEQENRGIAHLAIISSRGAELMYQNKETFEALSEASRIRGLGKKKIIITFILNFRWPVIP